MTQEERRRCSRKDYTDYWTKVSLIGNTSSLDGQASATLISVRIENISLSGACITSEQPFELDQHLKFHDKDLDKSGKVVWTCQSKEGCKAGVHFD